MGPGLFVIAILGCGDGSVDCRAVTTLPTRYENRASCAAATGGALMASTQYDYPELLAECRTIAAPTSTRNEQVRRTRQG